MIILSRQGAEYFCAGFSSSSGVPDIRQLYNTVLASRKSFKESDGIYEQYRDALLREADRSFFLSISCYRRALHLFTAASVFWAHVSLYYASWYAAHAVLGIFGGWVLGRQRNSRVVVHVLTHKPGQQEFKIEKNYSSTQNGSHQIFWEAYYRAMRSVILWTDPALLLAVQPISNNPLWPIEKRNAINYRSFDAFQLMKDHSNNFDALQFPQTLHGDIATQFSLTRSLLLFSAARVTEFRLTTDVYPSIRSECIRDLIYRAAPPNLVGHSEERSLTI